MKNVKKLKMGLIIIILFTVFILHTLYGFHFEANYGYVDSEGYLVLEPFKDMSFGHSTIKINGVKKIKHYNKLAHQIEPTDAKNYCWICDGWIEVKFEYTGRKNFF